MTLKSELASNREELPSRDLQIALLEPMLVSSKEDLVQISPQLTVAKVVCNRACGYGYKQGLERLRVHLLENP